MLLVQLKNKFKKSKIGLILDKNRGVIVLITQYFLFLFFPLFVFLVVEFISRWKTSEIFYLYDNNLPLFIFSYFIIFILNATIFLLFNRGAFIIISTIFVLLVLINKFKLLILWEPFYPADIFLHSWSSSELLGFINFKSDNTLVVYILGFILINIIYFFGFKWFNFNRKLKLITLFLLLILNYYIFVSQDFREYKLQAYTWLNMDSLAWRQNYNYEHNWFIWWFYINLGNIYVKKPDNYSKKTIENILSNLKINKTESINKKPNVIVILSEAFWDINKLPGVNFSTNPLYNFDELKKQSIYGNLIVPTYWWKTVRTEFEVLTGNMMRFLPSGSIPYQQYVNKKIPSIINEFKDNWYSTLAIHPYEKNFFNRKNTYPFLWFDKFVWQEDLTNPKYKWPFISDDEFVNDIIYYYKNNRQITKKPQFIFGISMQNHFTYEWNKYSKNSISWTWINLSNKSLQIINNYAQGIHDADIALKKLVNYLDSIDEPTYLVYFWDHLGAMGDNYFTYWETWYLKTTNEDSWTQDELLKMYSTPFLIRNNFWEKKSQFIQSMGTSYLWNYILDILDFNKKSRYFDFISKEYKECVNASNIKMTINKQNQFINNSEQNYCNNSINNHSLLQYDLLFWDNFLEK